MGREVAHHQIEEGRFTIGRNLGGKIHGLSQSHGVTEVLCRSSMAVERGTNTQPVGMVTILLTTYEEERVGMSD